MAGYFTPGYGVNGGYSSGIPQSYGNQMYQNNNSIQQPYANQPAVQNTGSFMTIPVQGEAGANLYPVASGNTVMLIDFDLNKFWIKSNVNGVPQRLRAFHFKEEVNEQPQQQAQNIDFVSREEFNRLAQNVEKLIAELGGTSDE